MADNNTSNSAAVPAGQQQQQQQQQPSFGSSIHTVEGNVAGGRAALLEQKRQQDLEDFEQKKQQIHSELHSVADQSIESKFATSTVVSEQSSSTFKSKTIGLVTAEDFKKAAAAEQDDDENAKAKQQQQQEETPEAKAARIKAAKKAKKKKLKQKKKMMSTLSFAGGDDLDDDTNNEAEAEEQKQQGQEPDKKKQKKTHTTTTTETNIINKKKSIMKKDPTIDTSFLPDHERDMELIRKRNELEQQWIEQQEMIRQEMLEITYSYWDGTGHRRSVVCAKGNTIGDFLELCRKELRREFRELSTVGSDGLLYIKEDLIIPHDLTFYDLIATRARGKSGPLFHFDVRDDVRLTIDTRIEKEESHPGKVVERRWYDRNKHIFPASRWEIYNPSKEYGGYTIGDRVSNK